jgi:lipopolysaccharide export system protein LptA
MKASPYNRRGVWGDRLGPPNLSLLLAPLLLAHAPAAAQALDLSHGGPVTVTAAGGIDWNQGDQTVTAHDDARAVRGDVTVTADRLIAHYRKKAGAANAAGGAPAGATTGAAAGTATRGAKGAAPGAAPATTAASGTAAPLPEAAGTGTPAPAAHAASTAPEANGAPSDTGNNEIYRLEADGHVHIFTQTDQAWGDHGIYDIDQAVLVLTGHALRLTTPQDVLTARDSMEYWSVKHMAVGRGDATATSNDGRRIIGDTLVAYTVDNSAQHPAGTPAPPPPTPVQAPNAGKSVDPLAASGKIQRVEAYGHVEVRTATEIVHGDRGVYVPDTGMARVVGHVHITRGENQLNGAAAIVNMKTGVATLTQTPGARVEGLIVPNEQQPKAAPAAGKPNPAKPRAGTSSTGTSSMGTSSMGTPSTGTPSAGASSMGKQVAETPEK